MHAARQDHYQMYNKNEINGAILDNCANKRCMGY